MSNWWESAPVVSAFDEALVAEGVTGALADLARSIYEQESGSGRNTRTSNAGAVGGMQILAGTFREVADKDWDINNPLDNARAGIRYLQKLSERVDGDPLLTAVGYYGGPGGQDKARRGEAVSDPRNPKAPNTLEYARQVVGRMGASTGDDGEWWKDAPLVSEGEKANGKPENTEKPTKRPDLSDAGADVLMGTPLILPTKKGQRSVLDDPRLTPVSERFTPEAEALANRWSRRAAAEADARMANDLVKGRTQVASEPTTPALLPNNRRQAQESANASPILSALQSGAAKTIAGTLNAPSVAAGLADEISKGALGIVGIEAPESRIPNMPGVDALNRYAGDKTPQIMRQSMGEAWRGDDFGTWLAANLASNAPQMAQSLAAAFVPGAQLAALGAMGAQAAGNAYADGDSAVGSVLKGGIEVASERLPLQAVDRIRTVVDSMPAPLKSSFLQDWATRMVKAGGVVTANSLTGAFEESVAQLGGNAVDILKEGKDKSLFDGVDTAATMGAITNTAFGARDAYRAVTTPTDLNGRIGAELSRALQGDATGPTSLEAEMAYDRRAAIEAERQRLQEMRTMRDRAKEFVAEKQQQAVSDIGAQTSVDGAIAAANRAVNIDSDQLLNQALASVGIDNEALKRVDAAEAQAQAVQAEAAAKPAAPEPAPTNQESAQAPSIGSVVNQIEQPGNQMAAEPARVWYGRRGDGYATTEDAERGLKERTRIQSNLDWKIEPTPEGKFRLAGYAPQAAAEQTAIPVQMGAMPTQVPDAQMPAMQAPATQPTFTPTYDGVMPQAVPAPELEQPAMDAITLAAKQRWEQRRADEQPQDFEQNQPPAQQTPAVAATETVAPTTPIQLGRDQTPLAEGGKPFKTRAQAAEAKKLQPMMRVVSVPGGYALAEKTPAQIAAQERAARRLRVARTSAGNAPIPAHAFVAAEGGLHASTRADMNVGGNPRVGNRFLLAGAGRGITMEVATQRLVEEGYLPQGASQSDAMALTQRSLREPQYNADGIERIAQEEAEAQFEDYLAAKLEREDTADFDPFASDAGGFDQETFGLTQEDYDGSGYAQAAPEIKAEVDALLAQAEAMGLDTEELVAEAAYATRDQTEQEYYEYAKQILAQAIGQGPGSGRTDQAWRDGGPGQDQAQPAGDADRSQDSGGQGAAGALAGLTSPTEADVLAQQGRADAAAAQAQREQIRRESEAGAGLFELTREDGRQDTTGVLFSRAQDGVAEISRKAAFLQGKPIAYLEGHDAPHGYRNLRQWAQDLFKRQGGKATNPVLGDVALDDVSVADSMGHGMNPFKAEAFAAVKSVIELGVIVARSRNNGVGSFYISAPVNIRGVDDVVTVLVRSDVNKQRMYLHSVTTKDNLLKARDSGADIYEMSKEHTGKVTSGDVANVLHSLLTFKPEGGQAKRSFSGVRTETAGQHVLSTAQGTPAAEIRQSIDKAYPRLLGRLEAKGLVTLTQTEEQAIEAAAQARAAKTGGDVEEIKRALMAGAQGEADLDFKRSTNGAIEGFFDPQTGQSFLIADGLTAETAPGTLMHEVGIHMAADGKMQPLFDRAARLVRLGKGNRFFDSVRARMESAGETSPEEAAAYIVTEYENNRANAPQTVLQWLKDVAAAVRAWLFSKGIIIQASSLTAADIAAVARANAKRMADGTNVALPQDRSIQESKRGQPSFYDGLRDRVSDGRGYREDELLAAYVTGHHRWGYIHYRGGASALQGSIATAYWEGAFAGRDGYYTAAIPLKQDGQPTLLMAVFPLDALTDGSPKDVSRAFRERKEAWYLYATETPDGTWEIGTDGAGPGYANYEKLIASGELTPINDGYHRLKLPGGTTEWDLLREGARRLSMFLDGKTPTVQFVRATGANPGKSAKWTPERLEAKFSRQRTAQPQTAGYTLPEETALLKKRRQLQDYFLRVKKVQEAVAKQGGVVNETTDTYLAEELSHGRTAALLEDFAKNQVEPLMKKAVELGVDLDELALFAYAKHAPERNAQIARIDSQLPDGGSGMTNADANAIINQARQDGTLADLEHLHRDLMAITRANREAMLREGLITQDEYDALTNAYQNYIPLRGFEQVDEDGKRTGLRAGKGFNIRGKETMRAMGRTSRAGLLIENAIADYQRTIVRSERNQVAKVFLNFVVQNPDADLWEIDATTTRKSIDRQTGRVARSTVVDKGEDTIAVKVNGVEIYVRIKDELLLRAMRKAHKDETGEAERFLIQTVGAFTGFLRDTLTRYNPEFAVVNAMRDAGFGATAMLDELGEKGAAKFAAHYAGAIAASSRNERNKLDPKARDWDKWFVEFKAAGGTTMGFYAKGAEEVAKDVREVLLNAGAQPKNLRERLLSNKPARGVKAVLRVMEYAGAVSENAARVAAYRTAREMGKTPAQAASIAKNLTTNFDRKGEFGQAVNALYMFFNAAVQGSHRTLKMLGNKKVLGYMAGMTAASIGMALWMAGLGGEDEDDGMAYWDKIPAHVKERNFIIMLPPGGSLFGEAQTVGKNGRYFAIPAQYGLNLFHLLGYQIADVIRNQRNSTRGVSIAKASVNMASAVAGAFNPFGGAVDLTNGSSIAQAVLPTAGDVVVQLATGTNAFGRDVAPYKSPFDDRPDSENVNLRQQGSVSHRIAQWINTATGGDEYEAGAVDISPGTVENIIGSLTGGSGRFVYDSVNLAAKSIESAMGGDPDILVREAPMLRRIYGELDGDTDQALFYERRRAVNEARGVQKRREEAGLEMTNKEKEAMAILSDDASQYTSWLSDIRKEMMAAQKDAEITDTERKTRLRELRKERDTLTAAFNKAWMGVMQEYASSTESVNR